jgi:hypothetical protein
MQHEWERREMHTIFWLDAEDIGKIILEWILERQGGKLWIGFIWLKIGTNSGLL